MLFFFLMLILFPFGGQYSLEVLFNEGIIHLTLLERQVAEQVLHFIF